MNSVVLAGKISLSAKLQATQTGKQSVYFGLALEEHNQGKIYTTYVDVICYGKAADAAQFLQKNQWVVVSGKLMSKKKGEVYTLGVMANQVQAFDLKKEEEELPKPEETAWQPELTESDIPF